MSTTIQETTQVLGIEFSRERVRLWGVRGGLSVLDQGLISGAGFLLNLFLARWLTGEEYGAFAVAFATVLFLSGYHNVLLLEPMTVLGPARYSDNITGYFLGQLKLHGILVAVLSGLMLLAALVMAGLKLRYELLVATATSAVALPFILLLWLVRRMCYVAQRPPVAACGSAVYLVLMLAGLFVLHAHRWLGVGTAFLLMTGASIVGVALPLKLLMQGKRFTGCSCKEVGEENWNYGRWLVASTTLSSVSSQAQTYLVAGTIGLTAAGILRAMQVPALVMTQIVTATSLLVLPTMSYDFGMGRMALLRKKALLSTLVLTAMGLVYAAALALIAKPAEHLLYGGKFAAYAWLIPVLGLVPACTGFTMGLSMAQRACQKPQYDLWANAIAAPVALVSALGFVKLWGLGGAAFSLVASFATIGLVYLFVFLRQSGTPPLEGIPGSEQVAAD